MKKRLIIIYFLLILFLSITLYIKNNKKEVTIEPDLKYYKNIYSNNDIVGKLKIEGTNIDALLVMSTNNEYYLNHNINKELDVKGSIFLDYRTNLNSKQINIYGHNSKDYILPFKELEKYKDKEFYEKHKVIELWDGINTFYYKIFSIQITSNNNHMNINPSDRNKHINILSKSIYNTNENVNKEDDILILQTCNYSKEGDYLLIIAKKI